MLFTWDDKICIFKVKKNYHIVFTWNIFNGEDYYVKDRENFNKYPRILHGIKLS